MRTKLINNKDYVLCSWRRRWVRLTPEEWVRQHFLDRLTTDFGYPHELIAVEVPLATASSTLGSVPPHLGGAGGGLRADAIVYDKQMQPLMLLEFKREDVALTQRVLDQAAVYNRQLHVPYLILSNGPETIIARVHPDRFDFLPAIPTWTQLSN